MAACLLICICTNQPSNASSFKIASGARNHLEVPGRSFLFAEPVAGVHTPESGIDVPERVVEVQGYLPQAAHYPFRHRRALGRGIHVGRKKVLEVQGCLPQAVHHPFRHYCTLGRGIHFVEVQGCLLEIADHPAGHRQTLHRIH